MCFPLNIISTSASGSGVYCLSTPSLLHMFRKCSFLKFIYQSGFGVLWDVCPQHQHRTRSSIDIRG
uniref:Uncharacterized protein n=1 Tax=Arundo donax TaxID=35708 RepID=A0A0A9BWI6_ARUDO